MNNTIVVVGTQWGDEGKGKITNYLSEKANFVVRYQGGDNAGHTIRFNNTTYKLHLLPSGIFNPRIINVLGNGMVINVRNLLKEIRDLVELGFSCTNIRISDRANIIFDYHLLIDGLKEEGLGDKKIGTTKKGIGPAYTDKIARNGIRMIDFIGPDFRELFREKVNEKNEELLRYNQAPLDFESLYQEYSQIANIIRPFVTDTISLLNNALDEGKKILFEGAQGSLLDVDFGSYPYVTSSNPSAGGVAIGSGIGPTRIKEVLGVVKAYSTRVGSGTFVTEFEDEIAHYIRETAHEYGTTTRRPRRIGWFDSVVLNYSRMINGLTGIAVTLLDVLSSLKTIKICTAYELDGKIIRNIPAAITDYDRCLPVYEELPGWDEDISQVRSFEELPINAQNYLKRIEILTGVPIVMFSVGPDKTQTIIRKEIF
ncbi:MAG: adenylosuccinate synthase [Acholeplasmataceae bacterium]|nr:adenylosuccinate synthase [Acholeplasmataceae bacterium]